MKAYASLMSWYVYDDSLFDDCVFPEDADRDVIIQELLAETAEQEAIYPDFDVMKQMLGVFTKTRIHAWERMFRALQAEYNPIWNKDGTIEERINSIANGTADSTTDSVSDGYVTAFNDDMPKQNVQNKDQTRGQTNSMTTGDQTTYKREYGNIGVTKSSELVRDEIVLRASYDISHIIVAEMKRRFCLLMY